MMVGPNMAGKSRGQIGSFAYDFLLLYHVSSIYNQPFTMDGYICGFPEP